jgi:hypothetical protein
VSAIRVGNEVLLRWKTPERTTDKMLIAGPIAAEICRQTVATTSIAAKAPCSSIVLTEQVKPGVSEAADVLPAELTAGAARLLAYRVLLSNDVGRTAGASDVAYAAAGAAPAVVEELRGWETKAGVVLEWRASGADAVELTRTLVQTAADTSKKATAKEPARKIALPGASKESTEVRLRVGSAASATDAGGTIDRTVPIGETYRYSAQRVQAVELGGQRLEIRSAQSAEAVVEMKNVFPPEAPTGLVAIPGFAGETNDAAQKTTIELSWEPNMEPHIAGYRVYRRDAEGDGTWRQLDSELVPVAAYRDKTVVAGRRYGYRVTAVDAAGNESAPSDAAAETAPTQ